RPVALSQPLGRVVGGREGEDVALLQVAVPAAQTLQALLLLLELRERELRLRHFAVDLGDELRAVRDELSPLVLARAAEGVDDQRRRSVVVRADVEGADGAAAFVRQRRCALQGGSEG